MNITELKFNSIKQADPSLEAKVDYFKQGLELIKALTNTLEDVSKSVTTGLGSIDDGFDLLMEVETMINSNVEFMTTLEFCKFGNTTSIRRRCLNFCRSWKELKDFVAENIEVYIPFDPDQLVELDKLMRETLGELCCFVYYQFELNGLENYTSDDELEINNVIERFKNESGLSYEELSEFVKTVKDIILKTGAHIGVFSIYPDLLEPFSDVVGEAVFDCDEITIDTVQKVLSGEMSVEEFNQELEALMAEESF